MITEKITITFGQLEYNDPQEMKNQGQVLLRSFYQRIGALKTELDNENISVTADLTTTTVSDNAPTWLKEKIKRALTNV
jgi:hypothetical protein